MTDPLMPTSPTPSSPQGKSSSEEVEELHPFQDFLLKVWTEHRSVLLLAVAALIAVAVITSQMGRAGAERRQSAVERLNAAAGIYQRVTTTPNLAASDIDAMLSQAAEICDRLRLEFPNQDASREALFIKANCLYERAFLHIQDTEEISSVDLMDEAIQALTTYLDEVRSNSDKAKARIALANCYENRAFFTDDSDMMRSAIAELERAADLGEGTYLEAQALKDQARCLESLSRFDEARLIYERITRLRQPLSGTAGTGVFALSQGGGYSDLAEARLARLASGIDVQTDR